MIIKEQLHNICPTNARTIDRSIVKGESLFNYLLYIGVTYWNLHCIQCLHRVCQLLLLQMLLLRS